MAEVKKNKRTENKVVVVGELKKLDVKFIAEAGADKVPMKIAEIHIESGEGEVHIGKMMAMESYKDKEDPSKRVENRSYKAITTMEEEYVSKQDISEGKAPEGAVPTVVRLNGHYELNIYKNRAGELKEVPQIQADFVNRVDNPNPEDFGATFSVDGVVIAKGIAELDNDENETGVVKFKVAPLDFKGMAHPIEFKADDEIGEYFLEEAEIGSTVSLQGIVFNKFIFKEVERVGGTMIGSKKIVDTKRESDRRIFVDTAMLIEDEDSPRYIKEEEYKEALKLYEAKKVDEQARVQGTAKKEEPAKKGLIRGSKSAKPKVDIKSDDLPF